MMAERGVVVSYETIREWCQKFGQSYTKRLRARRGHLGNRWHLDEVFLKIQGKLQYLAGRRPGRRRARHPRSVAAEQAGRQEVLSQAVERISVRPASDHQRQLPSYAAAKVEVMPSVEHQQQGRLNDRAENSHQPTRERERRMRGFKSPGHAQRFLSTFGVIGSFFRHGRHLLAVRNCREIMRRRFTEWRELVGAQSAI